MSISAISSTGNTYQTSTNNSMDQLKQNFEDLGTALNSGNLDDAKKTIAKIQKNAASQGSDSNNPMNADIASIKKALDLWRSGSRS